MKNKQVIIQFLIYYQRFVVFLPQRVSQSSQGISILPEKFDSPIFNRKERKGFMSFVV
jgi:hypothetical protein